MNRRTHACPWTALAVGVVTVRSALGITVVVPGRADAQSESGRFAVAGFDPLAQFEEVRPKLVGVVGDDVVRTGVEIGLTRIGE